MEPRTEGRKSFVSRRVADLLQKPSISVDTVLLRIADAVRQAHELNSSDFQYILQSLHYSCPTIDIPPLQTFETVQQLIAAIELAGYHKYATFGRAVNLHKLTNANFRNYLQLMELRQHRENAISKLIQGQQSPPMTHSDVHEVGKSIISVSFEANYQMVKDQLDMHNCAVQEVAADIADALPKELFIRRHVVKIDLQNINPNHFADRLAVDAAARKIRAFRRESAEIRRKTAEQQAECVFKPELLAIDRSIFTPVDVRMTRSAVLKREFRQNRPAKTISYVSPSSTTSTPQIELRHEKAVENHYSRQYLAHAEAERVRKALADPQRHLAQYNVVQLTERQEALYRRLSGVQSPAQSQDKENNAKETSFESHNGSLQDTVQCDAPSVESVNDQNIVSDESQEDEDGLSGQAAQMALLQFIM